MNNDVDQAEEYFIIGLKQRVSQQEREINKLHNELQNHKKYVKEIEFKYHQQKRQISEREQAIQELKDYIEDLLASNEDAQNKLFSLDQEHL